MYSSSIETFWGIHMKSSSNVIMSHHFVHEIFFCNFKDFCLCILNVGATMLELLEISTCFTSVCKIKTITGDCLTNHKEGFIILFDIN